jgi:hypothetical protein
MDDVANNEITTKKLGGVTGKGFMPGVSGNPSGRPKNTLKEYDARRFREMSDEQKEEFLKTIPPEIRYRMAEGNPATATDITTKGLPIIQLAEEIIEKNEIDTSPSNDSEG